MHRSTFLGSRVAIDEAVGLVRAGAVAAQGCVEAGATKVKGATVRMPEKPIDRPESPAAELDVARGVAEKLDEHGVSSDKADRAEGGEGRPSTCVERVARVRGRDQVARVEKDFTIHGRP